MVSWSTIYCRGKNTYGFYISGSGLSHNVHSFPVSSTLLQYLQFSFSLNLNKILSCVHTTFCHTVFRLTPFSRDRQGYASVYSVSIVATSGCMSRSYSWITCPNGSEKDGCNPPWMLETEPGSSVGTASALNPCPISPAPFS